MGASGHTFREWFLTYPQFFAAAVVVICLVILIIIFYTLRMKIKNQEYLTRLARLEQERYRIAAEISNDILFEYDIRSDIMEYADKYQEIFGRKPQIYHYAELMEEKDYIHPEDIGVFELYLKHLHQGNQQVETEYRTRNADGEFVWCHIQGKTIYDSMDRPLRIIGKLVNIDVQKKELERLQHKAQMDPFTNVYNKMVTREKIEQKLRFGKAKHKHALLVLDIDNFKSINDQRGHQTGDLVIEKLVSILKRMFREEDIIGRIGGDEFVVFMTNISSREDVENKVSYLEKTLRQCSREEDPDFEVTCSVGISFYPKDGDSYDELFEKADKALYYVKSLGKGNFYIYQE